MSLRGSAAANGKQKREEMGVRRTRRGRQSDLKVCVTLGMGTGPGYMSGTELIGRSVLLTLELGSETGSNEKFSMRLAWHRDWCSVLEMVRISCSASGLSVSSRRSPAPAREERCCRPSAGCITSVTSLKRTSWAGWS